MAEHGCQQLLNFTCYNLDRQGEVDVRVPSPSFRIPWEGSYVSSQGPQSTLGLWPEVGSCSNMTITVKLVDVQGASLRKEMKVNNPAHAHCWGDVGMR